MSNKTPHPHKELLAEWLEDTSRTLEVRHAGSSWEPSVFNASHDISALIDGYAYRIAPVKIKIKIGDRELVAPMRAAPEIGSVYWRIDFWESTRETTLTWTGDEVDFEWLEQGRCFDTKADCVAMRAALLELLK